MMTEAQTVSSERILPMSERPALLFGYETDGVPAPSDFELTPAADRVAAHRRSLISFESFCHDWDINGDSDAFHKYVRGNLDTPGDLTWQNWQFVWKLFTDWEDSRDLSFTQMDALR